jgi:hypothetical protein
MKRCLFLLGLLLCVNKSASAACNTANGTNIGQNWTMSQCNSASSGAVAATSQAVAWSGAVGSGHLLVAAIIQGSAGSGAVLSITSPDPGGNSWTCTSTFNVPGVGVMAWCYVLNSAANAAYSIVATSTVNNQFLGAGIQEFSNSAGVSAGLDTAPAPTTGTTAGPNQVISTPLTLGGTGELIIGECDVVNGPLTPGTGFSDLNLAAIGVEANTSAASGSFTVSATDAFNGDNYGVAGIAFKAPAGGAASGSVVKNSVISNSVVK